ncbi:hypothetical protein SSAG_00131 [Streptomyces sp. Mg1]|nr:hypothetical protein SSAG_00131 [Streptomyces sp. Mg1]
MARRRSAASFLTTDHGRKRPASVDPHSAGSPAGAAPVRAAPAPSSGALPARLPRRPQWLPACPSLRPESECLHYATGATDCVKDASGFVRSRAQGISLRTLAQPSVSMADSLPYDRSTPRWPPLPAPRACARGCWKA